MHAGMSSQDSDAHSREQIVTVVTTPEKLRQAVTQGAQYILIQEHLDLRTKPLPDIPQFAGPEVVTKYYALGSLPPTINAFQVWHP